MSGLTYERAKQLYAPYDADQMRHLCALRDIEIERLRDENAKLREQTELLVTLLRNDCDIEASWDGLRHFWSIELTDDGCLMRDRACKAEAESAKLRELMYERAHKHAIHHMTEDELRITAANVMAENAKLRELVLCLLTCSSDTGDVCDKCPVNGGSGIWEFEDFCDSLLDRVHELGVEVSDA